MKKVNNLVERNKIRIFFLLIILGIIVIYNLYFDKKIIEKLDNNEIMMDISSSIQDISNNIKKFNVYQVKDIYNLIDYNPCNLNELYSSDISSAYFIELNMKLLAYSFMNGSKISSADFEDFNKKIKNNNYKVDGYCKFNELFYDIAKVTMDNKLFKHLKSYKDFFNSDIKLQIEEKKNELTSKNANNIIKDIIRLNLSLNNFSYIFDQQICECDTQNVKPKAKKKKKITFII